MQDLRTLPLSSILTSNTPAPAKKKPAKAARKAK